jgi:hypothetical protein
LHTHNLYPSHYYYGDKSKEDVINEACSTNVRFSNHVQIFIMKPRLEEITNCEDLDMNEKIILKVISRIMDMNPWTTKF